MQSGERIVINGRDYRLGNVLSAGAGSYGHVWAATSAAGYPVALKLINTLAMEQADPSLQGHWRAHLEREIAFLSRLDSEQARHIVTLFDHGQIDGQPVLVMEQLSANLSQWLAQKRQDSAPPLALERILDWASQILSGLEVIHNAGFVYRDLKFSNILVDQDGALLKLTDFGSLKRHDGNITRSFVGTPATMAPEQVLPAATGPQGYEYAVGPRADYYALGLLLFTLLTDQPATAAQRRLGQLLAQYGQEGAAQRREELGELNDQERELLQRSIEFWTVPVSTQPGGGAATLLANLITRLLARDPEDRPGNAMEIRAVLDTMRAGQLTAYSRAPKQTPVAHEPDWDISPLTLPPHPRLRRSATVNRSRYSRTTKTLIGILVLVSTLAWAIALRPFDNASSPAAPESTTAAAIPTSPNRSAPVTAAPPIADITLPTPEGSPAALTTEEETPELSSALTAEEETPELSSTFTAEEETPEPSLPVDESIADHSEKAGHLKETERLANPAPSEPREPLLESPAAASVIAQPQAKPAAPAKSTPSVIHRPPPTTAKVVPSKPRQERIAKPTSRTERTAKTTPASASPAKRPTPVAISKTPKTPKTPVALAKTRQRPTAAPPKLPPIELKSRPRSTRPSLPPIELTSRSQPTRPALPPIELTSRSQPTRPALPPIRLVSRTDPAPAASATRRRPAQTVRPAQRASSRARPSARQATDPITQFQKDAARAATEIRHSVKELTQQVSRTGSSVRAEIQRGLRDVEQAFTNNNNATRVERRDHSSSRYTNPPPRRRPRR
ncbi:MAG: protein kinase [Candidatus Competibacteraceae bacterium]|nr:protein kinase [Candidatus Competibacteraceae bacterium]